MNGLLPVLMGPCGVSLIATYRLLCCSHDRYHLDARLGEPQSVVGGFHWRTKLIYRCPTCPRLGRAAQHQTSIARLQTADQLLTQTVDQFVTQLLAHCAAEVLRGYPDGSLRRPTLPPHSACTFASLTPISPCLHFTSRFFRHAYASPIAF